MVERLMKMTKQGTSRAKVSVAQPPQDEVLTTLASTSQRNQALEVSERLLELRNWLADDLSELEQDLGQVVQDPGHDLAWRAVEHLLHKAGKRVRPICALLAARIGNRPFALPFRPFPMPVCISPWFAMKVFRLPAIVLALAVHKKAFPKLSP